MDVAGGEFLDDSEPVGLALKLGAVADLLLGQFVGPGIEHVVFYVLSEPPTGIPTALTWLQPSSNAALKHLSIRSIVSRESFPITRETSDWRMV